MKTLNRIVSVLLVEAVILCFVVSYSLAYKFNPAAQIQSTATLLIFNVIFVSLFFRLNGSLNLKLFLLAIGNFTGLCWNYIFNSFGFEGSLIYGESFNRLCLVFFPFLSSLWIVSFWSLSLTLVHKEKSSLKEF